MYIISLTQLHTTLVVETFFNAIHTRLKCIWVKDLNDTLVKRQRKIKIVVKYCSETETSNQLRLCLTV